MPLSPCAVRDWDDPNPYDAQPDGDENVLTLNRLASSRARGRHLVQHGPMTAHFQQMINDVVDRLPEQQALKLGMAEHRTEHKCYVTLNTCVVVNVDINGTRLPAEQPGTGDLKHTVLLTDGQTSLGPVRGGVQPESILIDMTYTHVDTDKLRNIYMWFDRNSSVGRSGVPCAVLSWEPRQYEGLGQAARRELSRQITSGGSPTHAVLEDQVVKSMWDWRRWAVAVSTRMSVQGQYRDANQGSNASMDAFGSESGGGGSGGHGGGDNAGAQGAGHNDGSSQGRAGGFGLDEAMETMGEDADGSQSIMTENCETFVVIHKKDGEVRKKIMSCVFVGILGMYRIVADRSITEPVYEILVEVRVDPSSARGLKVVQDVATINDADLRTYERVMIPITLRQSDFKTISSFTEKMGSFWPPLGMAFTRHFTLGYLRDVLQELNTLFLMRQKQVLRAIDNFGFQYGCEQEVFVFANCVINVSTGKVLTHEQAGYKLMQEIFAESQLSPNFYPRICPVEDPVLRLRFLRTLIHLSQKFTGVNYETFMVVFASYLCAPKFEYIQQNMFGVFINVLTSSEGSTGKTEMVKMLNALFGMCTKAMCASATDAGLYEILGKIFSCIPICVDDLKYDPKHGSGKLDETIKSLYDAMVRVVYKKMRSSRCQLMVTTNFVFCPNDQPVQSRLLLQTVRKIASFDSSLLSHWRIMQSMASMLCEDVLAFPINKVCVQDCIDFMTCILASKCVGTRSSQNWGLALYFRLLLQYLVPCEPADWDSIFRYMSREICRITVEYSSDAGVIDKFATCFRQMARRNDRMQPEGRCFNLHNLRVLTAAEKDQLDLDPCPAYYAFVLDDIVDVMCVRLGLKKEEFNVKGIKLMFRGQLVAEGVREGFVSFYDQTSMLLHQKNMETYVSEEDFETLDEAHKATLHCFLVPRLILDHDNSPELEVVDFRAIIIGRGRNLYTEIIEGTWRGFADMKQHELYKAAEENGLWNGDDWADPEYEERQFTLIENMMNFYLPEGTINWPRPEHCELPEWGGDFYTGHARVFVDAREQRRQYEREQEKNHERDARNLRSVFVEGEGEEGLDEFEQDDMLVEDTELDCGADSDPWATWVRAEFPPTGDRKTCPKCRVVYSTDLAALLCGACYGPTRAAYEVILAEVDEQLQEEATKRQRVSGGPGAGVNEAEEVDEGGDESSHSSLDSDGESLGSDDSDAQDEADVHGNEDEVEVEDGHGLGVGDDDPNGSEGTRDDERDGHGRDDQSTSGPDRSESAFESGDGFASGTQDANSFDDISSFGSEDEESAWGN